jgi:hypothetical protein
VKSGVLAPIRSGAPYFAHRDGTCKRAGIASFAIKFRHFRWFAPVAAQCCGYYSSILAF